jgi:hypothetical protein
VCIQGDWSNLADAKIKTEIAARALGHVPDARYNPLYARAVHAPRPWGVTALFTEYTGAHEPMPLVWNSNDMLVERKVSDEAILDAPAFVGTPPLALPVIEAAAPIERTAGPLFATVGDLARALNRRDPIALEIAARDPERDISIEGATVRKLVVAIWFRSVFPKFSSAWQERLLDALAASVVIPNHVLLRGRQPIRLADGSYDDLKAIASSTTVSGAAGADLHLVLAILGLWGEDARSRLQFLDVAAPERSSRLGALFGMNK